MDARGKKKLVDKILRFARSVDKTTSEAMNDPIHEMIYHEEMTNYCVKALELLGECKKALEEKE